MKPGDFRSAFADSEILDRSIEAWKSDDAPIAHLSPRARAGILSRVGEPSAAAQGLRGLFLPAWRWAWAGVLPVVVLTIALGVLGMPQDTGKTKTATRVEAHKLPGEVVFLIANGGVEHRVSRRSIPDGSSRGTSIVTTDGAFRDALDSGETIVFYRID